MELYIHIPFCRSKCRYCDFASYPGREEEMARYVSCLIREAQTCPAGTPVETVFIGGGTPSLLPAEEADRLLTALRAHFCLQPGCEFTCECNPGTLRRNFLKVLKKHGCSRLSLGAQASRETLLKRLGRIHVWEDVTVSVAMAREEGFDNISLDLMFGLPGQTLADWQETLAAALALEPKHLSCYGLIIEEGTPFFEMDRQGTLDLPDEKTERQMYDWTLKTLTAAGLPPYEISNFARPGYECLHNLGYWRKTPYLGLGAAAHSMLPCKKDKGEYLRRGNTPDLSLYMNGIESGQPAYSEHAHISHEDAQFETWMLGLRTTQGVQASEEDLRRYGDILNTLITQSLLEKAGGFYRLTRAGMDVQNQVLVALMDA